MQENYTVDLFSPHLFWDVDKSLLDFNKSKAQIIGRVVEYGLMKDWKLLQEIYSKAEIKETVCELRSLDKVTLSFLAHFLKIDKTEFRCYTLSQSTENFWNS
jgi:hypothetical protein